LVDTLVKQLQGYMRLERETGTRFIITFPLGDNRYITRHYRTEEDRGEVEEE